MTYFDLLEKCKQKINNYETILKSTDNIPQLIEILIELYNFVKEISLELWNQGYKFLDFDSIINSIFNCTLYIPRSFFITSIKPNFNINQNNSLNNYDDSYLLHEIVQDTRKYLYSTHHNSKLLPFSELDLTNYCQSACYSIMNFCESLKRKYGNIKTTLIKINPGFVKGFSRVYDGRGYHYFVVIDFNKNSYLVDCTYSQFFLLSENIIERIGIINFQSANAGLFMNINPKRKLVAEKILRDGWILLTPEVLKLYLDGFAISYRNGLYYERTGDYSFETNYTPNDYINFLMGNDNQESREGYEVLGPQRIPLKNPHMKLNKR